MELAGDCLELARYKFFHFYLLFAWLIYVIELVILPTLVFRIAVQRRMRPITIWLVAIQVVVSTNSWYFCYQKHSRHVNTRANTTKLLVHCFVETKYAGIHWNRYFLIYSRGQWGFTRFHMLVGHGDDIVNGTTTKTKSPASDESDDQMVSCALLLEINN